MSKKLSIVVYETKEVENSGAACPVIAICTYDKKYEVFQFKSIKDLKEKHASENSLLTEFCSYYGDGFLEGSVKWLSLNSGAVELNQATEIFISSPLIKDVVIAKPKSEFRKFKVIKQHFGFDNNFNQPKKVELSIGDILEANSKNSNERGHLFFNINGNRNHCVMPNSVKSRHPYDSCLIDSEYLEEVN